MKENIKTSKSKEKITRETYLKIGQVLWGKTDSKEGQNHYKIIFDIIGEDNNRTISVIGITKNPKKDLLKINQKDFCGLNQIDGWLDVEYLNNFSYQEFLALPKLYLKNNVIADKDTIVNIKNIQGKLYELKDELLKTQEKLKKTRETLETEREDHEEFEINTWFGGILAVATTVGAFVLGQHLEEQNKKKKNT